MSERYIRKRTGPGLLAPIPGPGSHLEEVEKFCGQTARTSLDNVLTEFNDLLMKHKAIIYRCTKTKHPVEVKPGATSHREDTRRISSDMAEHGNQIVDNILPLGKIHPSILPWASRIVIFKKKNGDFAAIFAPSTWLP